MRALTPPFTSEGRPINITPLLQLSHPHGFFHPHCLHWLYFHGFPLCTIDWTSDDLSTPLPCFASCGLEVLVVSSGVGSISTGIILTPTLLWDFARGGEVKMLPCGLGPGTNRGVVGVVSPCPNALSLLVYGFVPLLMVTFPPPRCLPQLHVHRFIFVV